jgi:hypothetical protein
MVQLVDATQVLDGLAKVVLQDCWGPTSYGSLEDRRKYFTISDKGRPELKGCCGSISLTQLSARKFDPLHLLNKFFTYVSNNLTPKPLSKLAKTPEAIMVSSVFNGKIEAKEVLNVDGMEEKKIIAFDLPENCGVFSYQTSEDDKISQFGICLYVPGITVFEVK